MSRRPASAPSSGPSARAAGTGSASSTVTAIPRPRAALATSAPMNPAAHDEQRTDPGQRVPQSQRILHRAQRVHVGRLTGQRPRDQAGGDDEGVAAQERPVRQLDLAGLHRDRGGTEVGPHAELVELLDAAQDGARGLPRSGEHLLGQRRTVVRRVRFGADQADPAR